MFCSNCGNKLEKDEKFCSKCGKEVKKKKKENNKVEKKQDKNKTKDLIEYLEKVKTLEIRKYALNNFIDKSKYEIEDVLPYRKTKPKDFNFEYKKSTIIKSFIITFLLSTFIFAPLILALFIDSLVTKLKDLNYENYKIGIILISIYAFIVLFITIVHTIRKARKLRKTQKEVNQEKKLDLENVEATNKKVEEEINALTIRKDDAVKELEGTTDLLNKLYNLNYIHKKYHNNFVAVISFLDYLDTGRCDSLEGYTGAYNVYEKEIRQNMIISRLDDILVSLEQIKQNQYAMYCAIQYGNQLTESMMKSNKKISQNSQIIAENSEITTYLTLLN